MYVCCHCCPVKRRQDCLPWALGRGARPTPAGQRRAVPQTLGPKDCSRDQCPKHLCPSLTEALSLRPNALPLPIPWAWILQTCCALTGACSRHSLPAEGNTWSRWSGRCWPDLGPPMSSWLYRPSVGKGVFTWTVSMLPVPSEMPQLSRKRKEKKRKSTIASQAQSFLLHGLERRILGSHFLSSPSLLPVGDDVEQKLSWGCSHNAKELPR